jgi:hypothetical protein
MAWLIQRTDRPELFVARSGSANSYTRDLSNAAQFNTEQQAREFGVCDENECIVTSDEALKRGRCV